MYSSYPMEPDLEEYDLIDTPIDEADWSRVEQIIDRMAESQQPDNRFIQAIVEDTERREAIWGDDDETTQVFASDYDQALNRELGITSPKRSELMTMPTFQPPQVTGGYRAPDVEFGGSTPPGSPINFFKDPAGALRGALNNALTPGADVMDNVTLGQVPSMGPVNPWLGLLGGAAAVTLPILAERLKMPWETPRGEGMMSPFTNQMLDPTTGRYGQERVLGGRGYGNGGIPRDFGPGAVAYSYTNASKNGQYPATAEYIRLVDGKTYSRSLKTGIIKKVRRPKIVSVYSGMRLGDVAKAQRKLDTLYRQIAKRTPLKRGK